MELELENELRIAQQLEPVEVGNASLGIQGIKFNDLNADGIRQPGEPGLRDIPILLEPAATSNGVFNPNSGEALANSDPNGAFSFINLAPGNYRLTETVIPTGFRATTPNPLNATVVDRNVNVLFGNTPFGSKIVGCKYLDLDNDGFRDGDEPGIKNVRIYLDLNGNGQREAGEPNTLTGKNGAWSFTVAAGTYKVREERIRPEVTNGLRIEDRSFPPLAEPLQRNDFIQSTPPDNVPALDVTVRDGETFACAQVGNTPLYQIEVNKFQDLDRNGGRNVVGTSLEPAVNLVPFILDVDKDKRWDEGSEPIQLTRRVTDNRGVVRDGVAVFGDLFAGDYSVLEIFPTELSRDLLPAGTILPSELVIPGRPNFFKPANFNLPVATTDNPTMVSAPGPQARFQGTISREQPLLVADPLYALRGNDPRFVDTNFNGVPDGGERLIAATGERPIFANTPVAVAEPNPPLLRFSPVIPNSGNDLNSPVGNTRPNITVFKYNDLNGNRRFEPEQGEAGINGVQVFLDLNNDGQFQTGEPTRTTQNLSPGERPDIVGAGSRAGRTLFDNLAPGITYTVREVVPAGFSPSTADNVSVALNTQDAEVTFANTPNSKITGCKFEDFNQNGYRDGNEPAIANVTIFIDTNRDGVLQTGEPTRTTDQFGTFSFGDLRPGNYSIREVTPPGFFQTTQALDISLGLNQVFTCALVGNSRYYDLRVPKFNDSNRNGVRDGNEVPLAGIPFVLDLNRNGRFDQGVDSQVVRTGADGIALFIDLLPDTYSVLEVFNDPTVSNPFPIATGPNPVDFDVPGPNSVPSPARPSQTRIIKSLDLLTEGGLDATVKASSIDTSLIAGENTGISFVDDMSLSSTASALTVLLPEDKSKDLLLGVPATSQTGF